MNYDVILVPDIREGKLPAWARELLSELRVKLSLASKAEEALRNEMENTEPEQGDTLLELPESGMYRNLGDGARIRFGDFLDAEYVHGFLHISGDDDIEISPRGPFEIAVRPARKERSGNDRHPGQGPHLRLLREI